VAPTPTEEPTVAPTPTEEPTVAPTPTEEPTVAPTPTEQPTVAPTPTPEPDEDGGFPVYAIVLIILAVIALGIGGYLFMRGRG
jgi:hypothetical protein